MQVQNDIILVNTIIGFSVITKGDSYRTISLSNDFDKNNPKDMLPHIVDSEIANEKLEAYFKNNTELEHFTKTLYFEIRCIGGVIHTISTIITCDDDVLEFQKYYDNILNEFDEKMWIMTYIL